MHERAVGRADQLGPAVVDVLAERGRRIVDLAVDGEVHEVLELGVVQAAADEAELARGLLAALGEVALVEGEAKLSVLEDEVLAGVVVAAACVVSMKMKFESRRRSGSVRSRRHRMRDPSRSQVMALHVNLARDPAERRSGGFGVRWHCLAPGERSHVPRLRGHDRRRCPPRSSSSRTTPDADVPRRQPHRRRLRAARRRDAREAVRLLETQYPDLGVVDLRLPDGVRARAAAAGARGRRRREPLDPRLPLLVLSGRSGELDRVRGFDAGADDYVVQSHSPTRSSAAADRGAAAPRRAPPPRRRVRVGALEIDPPRARRAASARRVELSQKEFALLRTLAPTPTRSSRRRSCCATSGAFARRHRRGRWTRTPAGCAQKLGATATASSSTSGASATGSSTGRCGRERRRPDGPGRRRGWR